MKDTNILNHEVAYIEIYSPMAKALAFWHQRALGFSLIASYNNPDSSVNSYVLKSNSVKIVLTSIYPTEDKTIKNDINSFIEKNYCGVKRIALRTKDVKKSFSHAVENGAIPVKSSHTLEDKFGTYEQASIKLYSDNEILFVDDQNYEGVFKPNFEKIETDQKNKEYFVEVDHVAAELRVNEINFWTDYISKTIGTELIQTIKESHDNTTGMLLNISQSPDKKLTLVMAEPDFKKENTKIQKNIDLFGPGIHHLAFSTPDIVNVISSLKNENVELVNIPPAYYEILRSNNEMKDIDIDLLEKYGILIDKENDTYILQKFIKPITERPYFFYEIVQRVNGYNAFALNNINVLKKAEELQIIKTETVKM